MEGGRLILIQMQFNFSKKSDLKNMNEIDKNNIHIDLNIIDALTTKTISDVKKTINNNGRIRKKDKEKLEKLLSLSEKYKNDVSKLEIKLLKKRSGMISKKIKKKIYSHYITGLFSQCQLARMFGVAQSSVSRIISKINDCLDKYL